MEIKCNCKQSNSMTLTIIELLLTILLATGCLYHVLSISFMYFNYPTTVTVKVVRSEIIELPSLTVCNILENTRGKLVQQIRDSFEATSLVISCHVVYFSGEKRDCTNYYKFINNKYSCIWINVTDGDNQMGLKVRISKIRYLYDIRFTNNISHDVAWFYIHGKNRIPTGEEWDSSAIQMMEYRCVNYRKIKTDFTPLSL